MANIQIKKVLRKMYSIDYSKIILNQDDEFIIHSNGISEFTQFLKKVDLDNGIIVTPNSYRSGLFYSSEDDGIIYASSKVLPDLVNFGLNILGTKKNFFYRITIIARNTDNNTFITSDRNITVTDDTRQAILTADVKGVDVDKEYVGYFRALTNEANLFFTLGKVIIKDIIIDEVVLMEEDKLNTTETEDVSELIPENKKTLAAYGAFELKPFDNISKSRYIELTKAYGKGLFLSFDTTTKEYVLERSNTEIILEEPFTNINYIIEFNFNKVNNNGVFDNYTINTVSSDISPVMLKQGYVRFSLNKNNAKIIYPDSNNRVFISIYKIQ